MSRTLIWNTTGDTQVLPEIYESTSIEVRWGYVTSDDVQATLSNLGGFEGMQGKWAILPISPDEALGIRQVFGGTVSISLGAGGLVPWGNVAGKPAFATVATSGNYNHLTNKPVLAPVATAGSYDSLTGKPTIAALSSDSAANVGSAGSAGSSTTAARSDHAHAHGSHTDPDAHALAGAAAGFMSASDKSKLDSVAANAAALTDTTALDVSTSSGAGSAATAARADHTHAHGNQAGGSLHNAATTTANGFMSSTDKSKLDGIASGAAALAASGLPLDVGASSALGSSTVAAPLNHVHAHGSQAGGSLHATATTSAAGFMSASDKSKLDGVAASAAAVTGSVSPAAVASVAAVGASSESARADHAHAHGNQAGGALHAKASATDDGFMSKEHFAKVANPTYDLGFRDPGALAVGDVIFEFVAPRALVLKSIVQRGGAVAQVFTAPDLATAAVAVTLPGSVSVATGTIISVKVTTAGTKCLGTVVAVEA